MYFNTKNYLKNNHYHTVKHALNHTADQMCCLLVACPIRFARDLPRAILMEYMLQNGGWPLTCAEHVLSHDRLALCREK